MSHNPSISSLKKNDKSIIVDWSDGEQSKFNFLWLRDNCPSLQSTIIDLSFFFNDDIDGL
jgi:DUF971 family protein